jgi:NAD(P)-dependent dehydrogenase (short-subunit alcohol dehydrogenase family)
MPRNVLITGVTRGLGRAMLDRFVEQECVVRGCGRSAADVESLNESFGSPHAFAAVDVSRDTEVAGWARTLRDDGFVPDLLINNAALMNDPAPLWDVPPDQFAAMVDVNITGTFHVIRHFVPAMIERRAGVIVNFSSGWGRSAAAEVAPYCATKWAIEGLTQSLADELPAGMAAVPLNPGVIDTDMLRQCWGEGAGSYPSAEAWSRRAVPFLLSLGSAHNGQPASVP